MREWITQRLGARTLSEIKLQLQLAGPMCATYLLQVMVDMLTLIMVGHLGEVELAAAAYGNFYVNSTGFAILQGMCSAIDTLASQAFGARNFSRIGAIAQRGVLILGLLCTAQGVLWAFSGPILSSLGQDPEVVRLAAIYVAVRIPELPAAMLFEVAKRCLQAQGIVKPPAYVTGVTIAMHALLAYVLTFHTSFGFWGATASGILTRWAQALALLGYVWWRRHELRVVTVADLRRVASAEGGKDDREVAEKGKQSGGYRQVQHSHEEDGEECGVEMAGQPTSANRTRDDNAQGKSRVNEAAQSDNDANSANGSDSESENDEKQSILRKPRTVQGDSVVVQVSSSLSDNGSAHGNSSDSDDSDEESTPQNAHGTRDGEESDGIVARGGGGGKATSAALTPVEVTALSQKRLMRLPGDTVLGVIWKGWVWKDALSGWGVFITLGVPGAVMATLDWASFEALAVITGLLGVTQLAAHTVLAQIGSLSFLVPYGIAVASSVRVGQAMGRNDASGALLSARVSWAAGVAWGVVNFLLVVPTAAWWPYAFTSDEPVANLATASAWAVATFSVLDSLQQLNVGILKGIGQQCVGMVVYPLAYLGVGLPLAYALAHPGGLGVAGVWLGETLGAAVAVISLAALLAFRYDWVRLAKQCHALAATQQA